MGEMKRLELEQRIQELERQSEELARKIAALRELYHAPTPNEEEQRLIDMVFGEEE